MGTPVFAGYLIKGIDGTRCPKEYNLSEGEENNSYTVYILLEPFKTKESDIWNLPPDIDSELRTFWGEILKERANKAIESGGNSLYSTVEYSSSEDGAWLAVHGTTLEKIRADQAEAYTNNWGSVLELLVYYSNIAMTEEFNRRDRFKANAVEITFQEHRQTRR